MLQLGEYEVTVTDVTIVLFSLVALKRLIGILLSEKIQEPKKYEVESIPHKNRTLQEVQHLRCEEKRCLVVVNDKIYDMSVSRDLYENNRDTFEAENGCGAEWEPIFERKFPFVGKLVIE